MYLLDTCTFLWFLYNDSSLPYHMADQIEESEFVYISIASFWEIEIKKSIHKLEVKESVTDLEIKCKDSNIYILPIKTGYLEKIQDLPMIHNDPFDRLIMATAVVEDLILLTVDEKIKIYKEVKQL